MSTENKLQVIISESGLEVSKGQALLTKFGDYFKIADEWEKKASQLIVTDESHVAEMAMAREARLFLKGKRIDIEKSRVELKEGALREGQTIDAIAKILKNLIEPIEKSLESKEKFLEIREAEKKAQLKITREAEIEPYREFVSYTIDLGELSENDYSTILKGAQFQQKEKEAEFKRLEAERIENQKLDEIERQRITEVRPFSYFETVNSINLRTASEKDYLEHLKNLKAKKDKHEKEQEKIKAENAKLKAEADRKELELQKERAEQLRLQGIENERIAKEQAETNKKIEAQRLENERLQAQAEKLQKEASQLRQSAPGNPVENTTLEDSERFDYLINQLVNLGKTINFTTPKYQLYGEAIAISLDKIIVWAKSKIENHG